MSRSFQPQSSEFLLLPYYFLTQYINARGKSLYDYITGNNLSVSNRGCTPTFINSRSQTIVDITLTTWHISSLIQNWHVSDCVTLSDHQWINFEINLINAPKKPFRDPRRTDKDKYRRQLKENLEGVNKMVPTKCGEIEQYVKILQTATRQAFETSCPLRTSQQPNEATKWWCQELTYFKKKARTSFNKAKLTRLESDWESFKTNLKEFKKLVRQRQKDAWRTFCEEIEDYTQTARLCKILAKDKDHVLCLLKRSDGTRTTDFRESLELLMETHFPGSVITERKEWPNEVDTQPSDSDWQKAKQIVSEDRIRWAIQSFSPFKSPGIDCVYPALLQWGLDELLPHLVGVLRACLAHLYIPKTWREVKVVFIPKAGRMDYTTPQSLQTY